VCITLTDENFDAEVLEEPGPVLVIFSADWCGPCQMMAPVIEELASNFTGRIKMGRLDIDLYPRVAARYGIRATPTLLFFKDSQLVDHVVGVAPKRVLAEKFDSLLQRT